MTVKARSDTVTLIRVNDGADAITLVVTSSAGTIFKNASISTELTAHVYRNGTELSEEDIAKIGIVHWYLNGADDADSGTGLTYTLSTDASVMMVEARLEE
jgi:hypothetical protein